MSSRYRGDRQETETLLTQARDSTRRPQTKRPCAYSYGGRDDTEMKQDTRAGCARSYVRHVVGGGRAVGRTCGDVGAARDDANGNDALDEAGDGCVVKQDCDKITVS